MQFGFRASENWLWRDVFRSKRVEGREWRKMHNDELHDCRYFSPDIIWMIVSHGMRRARTRIMWET